MVNIKQRVYNENFIIHFELNMLKVVQFRLKTNVKHLILYMLTSVMWKWNGRKLQNCICIKLSCYFKENVREEILGRNKFS